LFTGSPTFCLRRWLAEWRVLNWTEVVAGMLRMLFASEILDGLIGPPDPSESASRHIQTAANTDINRGHKAWFDNLLDRIAEYRAEERALVESRAKAIIARCEPSAMCSLAIPKQS
jgi:hypothetical protein